MYLKMHSDQQNNLQKKCVSSKLPETHVRRKWQLYNYESDDEVQTDAEQWFRTEFINVALDSAIMSLGSCFQSLSSFGFLCEIKTETLSTYDLTKHCSSLE
jgi:hypothetical protein